MTVRLLLSTMLSLGAVNAAASDVSPFYRNQLVITEQESCANSAAREVSVSSFYKNQFAVTRAERCALPTEHESTAVRSSVAVPDRGDRDRRS